MTHLLRWPLSIVSGRFDQVDEAKHNELWASRLKMLVSTRRGERVMRPDYGCALAEAIFDPTQEIDPETAVREAVALYMPSLEIISVTITENGAGNLRVLIKYRTPSGDVEVLSVKELK